MITVNDIYAWLDTDSAESALNGTSFNKQQVKDMLGLVCASIASNNHPGVYQYDTRAECGEEAMDAFLDNCEHEALNNVMLSLGYACHEVDACQYEYYKGNTRATVSVDGLVATHVGIDVVVPTADPEPAPVKAAEEPLVGGDLFKAALADYTELMGKVLGMGTDSSGLAEIARQLGTDVEINGELYASCGNVHKTYPTHIAFFRIESYKHLGYIYFHINENCIEVSFDVFQSSHDDNAVLYGVSPKDLIEALCRA